MGLRQIGDSLWLAEGDIVDFFSFPYPTRMLIARLADNALWIWSPVKLSTDLRAEVDALGRVAHLVSPNKLHHLYLCEWKEAYPDAKLWGPLSTIKRRPKLAFEPPLQDISPPEWDGDIDQAWFRGSFMMDEIVFFHRPSGVVIFADLIEAFSDEFLCAHWNWWRRWLARLDGITLASPHAPLEWRLSFLDRGPARAARDKILGWPVKQAVVAHGEWPCANAREFVRGALAWVGPERA
ncbi:MAG: DUF4336 domain-containing protein [Methylocystis sp.]|uniref:DUF4336 domain-containing protein n=1 Tax=Methylocystis sp. TaxID=1911079 RepID=UPI003D1389E5